jgi:hypothetical protein
MDLQQIKFLGQLYPTLNKSLTYSLLYVLYKKKFIATHFRGPHKVMLVLRVSLDVVTTAGISSFLWQEMSTSTAVEACSGLMFMESFMKISYMVQCN